jgi:hypothetical protein
VRTAGAYLHKPTHKAKHFLLCASWRKLWRQNNQKAKGNFVVGLFSRFYHTGSGADGLPVRRKQMKHVQTFALNKGVRKNHSLIYSSGGLSLDVTLFGLTILSVSS